jgi:hypothetical protein
VLSLGYSAASNGWKRTVMTDIAGLIEHAGQCDARVAPPKPVEYELAETGPRRQRAGDPFARRRAERDDGLRELALLLGGSRSFTRRAREVAAKVRRYRPHPRDHDGSTERRVLHRLSQTGMRMPGLRQLRRILSGTSVGRWRACHSNDAALDKCGIEIRFPC